LLVYCGNDKILAAVDRGLLRKLAGQNWCRILLLGYDGALHSDGSLLLENCEMGYATIDTQPELQGRTAAELLVDEHRGVLTGPRSRYIDPRLLVAKAHGNDPSVLSDIKE
jgi:DNA-binding LacI/PurR family transcriptional regulator